MSFIRITDNFTSNHTGPMNRIHTTNYTDTFISVAEDCPVPSAEIPPLKGDDPTIAGLQFEMISRHPYEYTSDDVIFSVYARRKQVPASMLKTAREQFFSKGQACLRASPLCKRYGWGIHSDGRGRVALYAMGSDEYKEFENDGQISHVKAMRSSRKS